MRTRNAIAFAGATIACAMLAGGCSSNKSSNATAQNNNAHRNNTQASYSSNNHSNSSHSSSSSSSNFNRQAAQQNPTSVMINAPFNETFRASMAAAEQQGLKVGFVDRNSTSAKVIAENTSDTDVRLEMHEVAGATEIKVRYGDFGDRNAEDAFLAQLRRELGGASFASVPTN